MLRIKLIHRLSLVRYGEKPESAPLFYLTFLALRVDNHRAIPIPLRAFHNQALLLQPNAGNPRQKTFSFKTKVAVLVSLKSHP
jgi:hypothetical protein